MDEANEIRVLRIREQAHKRTIQGLVKQIQQQNEEYFELVDKLEAAQTVAQNLILENNRLKEKA